MSTCSHTRSSTCKLILIWFWRLPLARRASNSFTNTLDCNTTSTYPWICQATSTTPLRMVISAVITLWVSFTKSQTFRSWIAAARCYNSPTTSSAHHGSRYILICPKFCGKALYKHVHPKFLLQKKQKASVIMLAQHLRAKAQPQHHIKGQSTSQIVRGGLHTAWIDFTVTLILLLAMKHFTPSTSLSIVLLMTSILLQLLLKATW